MSGHRDAGLNSVAVLVDPAGEYEVIDRRICGELNSAAVGDVLLLIIGEFRSACGDISVRVNHVAVEGHGIL